MSRQLSLASKLRPHLPLNRFNDESGAAAYAESQRDAVANMPDEAFSTPEATSEAAIPLATAIKRRHTLRVRFSAARESWDFDVGGLYYVWYVEGDEDIVAAMSGLEQQLSTRYMATTSLWIALVQMEERQWAGRIAEEYRVTKLATMAMWERMVAFWEPLAKRLKVFLEGDVEGRKGDEIRAGLREILSGWDEVLPRPSSPLK